MRCVLLSLCLATVLACGCDGQTVAPATALKAQSAYDAGLEAFTGGNYGNALTDFNTAIESPGLTPDLLVDALLKRAQCHAEAGAFDAALADISQAEIGATELDQLHFVRGSVLNKKGDAQAAQAEFEKARQINPGLNIPE